VVVGLSPVFQQWLLVTMLAQARESKPLLGGYDEKPDLILVRDGQ
jgi:hypothetical protein